jgi:ABC-type transport system involved in multi-copper enzyme maturation permease subunit
MSTTVLTSPRKPTQAIGHPHPLLSVLAWELRRVRASRLFWGQALGFFVLVLFVIWLGREPDTSTFQLSPSTPVIFVFVAGTSAWGLLNFLPTGLVLLLGLLLPFVTADGVTRDLQRRTHELLMTTALPSRAYVWGRYLMGLLMSLGLALLQLFSILLMGLLLHLTITDYPAPELGNLLLLWVGMVVSATILLSSVSFALGTLFPRLSTLIKIGILLVWFVGAIMLPAGLGDQTAPPPGTERGTRPARRRRAACSSSMRLTSKPRPPIRPARHNFSRRCLPLRIGCTTWEPGSRRTCCSHARVSYSWCWRRSASSGSATPSERRDNCAESEDTNGIDD